MKKAFLSILFLITGYLLISQEKIEKLDVSAIIDNCNLLEEKGDFENALKELGNIPQNDSAYLSALTTKAYYLINLEKYEEAIQVCNEGIDSPFHPFKYYFLLNKASALLSLRNYDAALQVYDEMLVKYPKNYKLYYNKGLVYNGMEKFEEAVNMFQKSITFNPYYANSHLKLGVICFQEQHITQAMMCLSMYLLLNPDGENSFNILSAYNNMVETQNESEKHPDVTVSPDDESFEELDLIIGNYAALDKKYKISNKMLLPIIKQNHAMINKLSDYEGNGGFWDKYYVPFYKFIGENDLFDVYSYTIAFSVENPKYKSIVDKHINDIKSFMPVFRNEWGNIMGKNEVIVDGKTTSINYYYDNSKIEGMGKIENEFPVGPWEIYNDYGGLSGKGEFDKDGKKQGVWLFYDKNGNLFKKEDNNHGLLTNDYYTYFENEKVHFFAQYKNDTLHGKYQEYNEKGALIEESIYVDGKIEGEYLVYFPIGKEYIQYKIPYQNGLLEGVVYEYYSNGQLESETPFKADKKSGLETDYFPNGQIQSTANYVDGKLEGPFTDYYFNGNIKSTGNCVDGNNEGLWKEYYTDGSLKEESFYSKGRLDEVLKQYDHDGILYCEYIYRKGEVIAYKCYDKKGEVIKEGKKQKGEFYYEGHDPNGNIVAEGLYDISGGKMEEWKYYTQNQYLSSTSFYTENNLDGKTKYFFTNGEISKVIPYKNDSLEGYYTEYYLSKQLKEQGWYSQDNLEGLWCSYLPDGQLESTNYYTNGKLYGLAEVFATNGKIRSKYAYQDNVMLTEYHYTPDGNVYEEIDLIVDSTNYKLINKFVNGNVSSCYQMLYGIKHGKYSGYFFNGQLRVTGEYLNGERNGEWTWYHENGQIETVGTYVLDSRVGLWKEFHENGKIKSESTYVAGYQVGTETYTNEEGIVYQTLEYQDGDLNGEVVFYSEGGKLQLIRYYQFGTLVGYSYLNTDGERLPMIHIENETGKIISYFDNGNIAREMEYVDGKFHKGYKEYYYNGALCEEHHYEYGDRQGFDKTYYPDGTPKEERYYDQDLINGEFKKFHPNGQLKEMLPFTFGNINGLGSTYDESGKLIKETLYFDGEVFSEKKF